MDACYHSFIYLLIMVLLQACSGAGVAPVVNRGKVEAATSATITQRDTNTKSAAEDTQQNTPGFHIVNKGDTLYSIAWRYNFDYKAVADWNAINPPYTIYPGQFIRLKQSPKKKDTPLKPQPVVKQTLPATLSQPATESPPQKTTSAIKKPRPKSTLSNGPIKWSWPSSGALVKSNSPTSKKGINISGKSGQPVKAAAAGAVVYSGSGLLGYGKLIIIKHNETFLSAYAYNSKLLVKEGDNVHAGQQISEMGQDHTGRNVLHFEIRRHGKPVQPTQYLPKKHA